MQGRRQVNSALRRIRQAAERDKKVRFTSLLHHIYAVDMLREAYFSLARRAAPGVDRETWRHYGDGLRNISRTCICTSRREDGSGRPRPHEIR